jgi:hypothetical protein
VAPPTVEERAHTVEHITFIIDAEDPETADITDGERGVGRASAHGDAGRAR